MKNPATETPGSGPTIAAREADVAARRAHVASLYPGRTMAELARDFGCNPTTIWKDLKALGIERQPAGARRKYAPPPSDKTCAHCGGPITFRYPSDAVDNEYQRKGIYCSKECRDEGLRLHRKPEPRVCARPWCDNVFQPRGVDVAKGGGLYCSHECLRAGRGGDIVACPHCGAEKWLPLYRIERGYRFCDYGCWSRYRWQQGIELLPLLKTFPGRARQRWLGRWKGREYGALGGRPRSEISEERKRRIRLAARRWGRRRIASELGESEWTVRQVLDEADPLS